MNTREPRLATWILEHCVADFQCESLIGDLIEQFPQRGSWWYWWQAVASIRYRAVRTLVTAAATKVSAAEFVGDLIVWIGLATCGCFQLGLCTYALLSRTPFTRSHVAPVIAAALICGALLSAVTVAHAMRMRAARQPCVPRFPAW